MKLAAAILLLFAIVGTALAQPPTGKRPAPVLPPAEPLVIGAVVDSFEMVPDRTVIFEPTEDGKIRIVSATDKDRHAPMPRNPGQVAVSLTVAQEIGAVMEFNSGLSLTFTYQATVAGVAIPTCPAGGNAVASDQWPQGYTSIVIGKLRLDDALPVCRFSQE